jgi:hypothetical protein
MPDLAALTPPRRRAAERSRERPVYLAPACFTSRIVWSRPMKKSFVALAMFFAFALLATETTQAGIFGRRAARRQAELYGSLNASLSA